MIAALDNGYLDKVLRRASGEEAKERALLQDLEKVTTALEELDDLYFDGHIPKDRYLRQKTRKETERDQITRKLSGNGKAKVVAGLPRGADAIREAWDSNDLKWRRALVSTVLEKVIVQPHKRRGLNSFDPQRVQLVWRS